MGAVSAHHCMDLHLCCICTRIFMPMSAVRVRSHVSASAGPIGIAAKVQDMSFNVIYRSLSN
jgi:hypothetical protein